MSAKRFRVAFSFAGEKRSFVGRVAAILAERFTETAILYDQFHEAEFARRNLGIYLPELYHKESDLVVVVLCPVYNEKQWTGLEWTAIHDLLSVRQDDEVMLCRFNRATVKGLYSTAGFVELDRKTPEQAAALICERLALNEGKPKNHYTTGTLGATLYSLSLPPNNLPRLPHFFGREKELKAIADALQPDRQIWGALILGPGGIGKTSLAIRAALAAPTGNFRSILFLSAKNRELTPKGPKRLTGFVQSGYMEILAEIARLIGKPKLSTCLEADRAKVVIKGLQSENALLVLDNLETLPPDEQTNIFTFVSRLPQGCKAIVTTRVRTEEDGRIIELGKLNQVAALAYLAELAEGRPLLMRAHRNQRIRLYEETGGNPLLLRWVVGQLGRGNCLSIAKAIKLLKNSPPDNDPLEFVFGDLVGTMSVSEIKAIKGLHGSTDMIDVKALAKRAKLSITAARTVLLDLSDRGLVDADPDRQLFSVLPVVVAYLRQCTKSARPQQVSKPLYRV